MTDPTVPDVFSADELARVTGLPVRQVRTLIRTAAIPTVDGSLVARDDAVRACRALLAARRGPDPPRRRGPRDAAASQLPQPSPRGEVAHERSPDGVTTPVSGAARGVFFRDQSDTTRDGRFTGLSFLVSGSVHAAVLACILVLTTVAVPSARPDSTRGTPAKLVQLVFVADPGPGGGGGGGGRRRPTSPPEATRAGARPLSSPLPRRQPPALAPPRPKPVPPPLTPLDREPLPPLLAPLAAIGADTRDVPGLLTRALAPPAPDSASRGGGTGGGVGTGAGVGVGQGTGRGVGPGAGGGTGGGPYRPGSGIDPPGLLHEVTPDYTEEARRAGLEGEVLLEVVVGPDGGVSDVRVLRRLGAGLDERAVDAVRQWRFSPARRFGTPVAVVVEVAVEFTLR